MADSHRRTSHPKPRSRGVKLDKPPREENGEKNGHKNGGQQGGGVPWCRLVCEKGRKYTPWVLIRFNATDAGLRPLPANTPFWISPDIWVESSDPYGRPVVGEPNYVHARVFNLGKAPAFPTRVQFYWGDPSLGLGAATMNLIGTEWPYVPAHASLDVRCNTPWIPVLVNSGHECLIVNSSAPMLDPIIHPFRAWLDRHVGQRNVMVTGAGAGQLIKLQLAANNLFPMMARTQFVATVNHFTVEEETFRKAPRGAIINELASFGLAHLNTAEELLARYLPGTAEARLTAPVAAALANVKRTNVQFIRALDQKTRSATCITTKLTEGACRLSAGDTLGMAGHLFAATEALSPVARIPQMPGELLLQAVDLQPSEHRTLEVELRVPANAAPGEFVVMHIVQRVEPVPIGGYTVIAVVGELSNR